MGLKEFINKNIVSFDEDDTKKEGAVKPPSFSAPASNTVQNTQYSQTVVSSPSATIDNEQAVKFRNHLKDILRAANMQGPDYFEFSEAVEKNEGLNLPKQTAYLVAYTTLQSVGLTKQRLLESANVYIQELDKEHSKFQQDIEKRKESDVVAKDNEIKKLDDENLKKTELIQQLTQEIGANNTKKQQLTIEKMQAEEKLTSAYRNMQLSVDTEKSRIQQDIQLIQTTLQ